MRLYGEIIPELKRGDYRRTGAYIMLVFTCTAISSVDLAHNGVYLELKIRYLWIVVQGYYCVDFFSTYFLLSNVVNYFCLPFLFYYFVIL